MYSQTHLVNTWQSYPKEIMSMTVFGYYMYFSIFSLALVSVEKMQISNFQTALYQTALYHITKKNYKFAKKTLQHVMFTLFSLSVFWNVVKHSLSCLKNLSNYCPYYLIQCTLCTSALNMAVHFLKWYFHILITEGEPVCADAKMSVWPSNARAETCKILLI